MHHHHPVFSAAARMSIAAGFLLSLCVPAFADLCGRPTETPEALFERLTTVEKLPELMRDQSYVALNDTAKDTVWTFTVAGHPAHPSVVCRHPVRDGDDDLRIEMHIQCNAEQTACQNLLAAFEQLNRQVLEELKKKVTK